MAFNQKREELVLVTAMDEDKNVTLSSMDNDNADGQIKLSNNGHYHKKTTGEKLKETVTDKKFVQGSCAGFVAGIATGATVTHMIDKKKAKKEAKRQDLEGKRRLEMEKRQHKKILENQRKEFEARLQAEKNERELEIMHHRKMQAAAHDNAVQILVPSLGMPNAYSIEGQPVVQSYRISAEQRAVYVKHSPFDGRNEPHCGGQQQTIGYQGGRGIRQGRREGRGRMRGRVRGRRGNYTSGPSYGQPEYPTPQYGYD